MGSTLIFSYVSWLGPFLVQNFEFQYFWYFFFFFGGGGGGGRGGTKILWIYLGSL